MIKFPRPRRDPVRIAQELIAADLSDAARLADVIAAICAKGLWQGRGRARFESLTQFVVAPVPDGLGVRTEEAFRRLRSALLAKRLYREWIEIMEGALRRRGPSSKKTVANSENSPLIFRRSRSSTAVDQNLPRLMREHPDHFKNVEAGMISVHRASVLAGIVPKPAPRKRLRFGAVDFDALSSIKTSVQGHLLCEVFDSLATDAQCMLIASRFDGKLGTGMAEEWRVLNVINREPSQA